ncbi:hypothetical protein M409DRAFT_20844 [Zasmidium cellare ATCC 36951]|uniref:Ubiquitin-like-conjugating enzyme ATG10 n=1 Tax=Zasmidium cellare ATCC 36951 TaxID=1080233 RepID=A0A6A6CRM8_ZASCE|nr:uncharacterized protein M409DRAFT_20844 [Zasmidium cellare ATCC 36951]KAF2168828.1 hypothetical protein M409DRAFT_20844 [Zasmidium cellare ATCC 36951]
MSISSDELKRGLVVIQEEWQQVDEKSGWNEYDTTFLRITRSLSSLANTFDVPQTEDEIKEDDEEALVDKTPRELLVVYDIVHSQSYQVPVLYFNFKNTSSGGKRSIEEIYQMLVPNAHGTSMQAVGQLGAITLTEHPITGIPSYFVHPCRTREALEPALQGKTVKPAEYVMLWLGTIGSSVGLDISLPLAMRLGREGLVAQGT